MKLPIDHPPDNGVVEPTEVRSQPLNAQWKLSTLTILPVFSIIDRMPYGYLSN